MNERRKILLFRGGAALVILLLLFGILVISLQGKITTRLEKGWVLPPLELYSQGVLLATDRLVPMQQIEREIEKRGWQSGRDYILDEAEGCAETSGLDFNGKARNCLWIREPAVLVTWDESNRITDIFRGTPWTPTASFALFPQLITQFYDNQPILQQNTPLSEIPLACLQAVTAIEDRDFLEHRGVSATGIIRAMIRNLKAGRWAEGGSTITQQLVKNFFLTSKKTLRRKIEEQLLAVLMEAQLNKDQILEMYLNVIYMGQSGPYQVRGLGSAASHYFEKPVSRLSLAECALLAAIINSPGRYSPFDQMDASRARRELVLQKMKESNMIGEEDLNLANQAELPTPPSQSKRTHAPYFVMATLKEFQSLGIDAETGARLYTTLDPEVQLAALHGLQKALPKIEGRIKKPSQQPLQASVVVIDVATAQVLALLGGRDYRSTQYNRAVDSRRQIGSVVKPFVFWPALKTKSPLSPILDEPFEWKNGKQVWKPRNYEYKTYGKVPYFYALSQSLNIPAAKIGQEVGLSAVADTLRRAGAQVEIPELPSLTLGALEMSAMEVAQLYLTLARFGQSEELHSLIRVEDTNGKMLFEHQPEIENSLDPIPTAVLVGMLRQSVELGTARSIRAWGITGPFAGKTGTTSDTKDAWFVGFSPRLMVVTWVGYDDNTAMGLTGASAALPLWLEVVNGLRADFHSENFNWPTGVELRSIRKDELVREFPVLNDLKDFPEKVELILPDWAS